MKPLRLTMQAFGPFSGLEDINFESLGHNPLFLINGPTGAGKSSILDAMCFALYGQTTGAEREPAHMRCDRADPTLLTEIVLDFSLANKRYRIRRIPTQQRAKLRQQGTTTQQAEAQLWRIDNHTDSTLLVSKSVNEVTAQVKQLLGLDVEQFRQVMVLPQGKFLELLNADSSQREKIFSQLFQTHAYKKIEDILKSEASGIRHAVEEHRQQIKGVLQAAEAKSRQHLDDLINDLEPEIIESLKQKKQAFDALNVARRDEQEALSVLKNFDTLALKRSEYTQLIALTDDYAAKRQRLNNAQTAQKIQPIYDQHQQQTNRSLTIKQRRQQAEQTVDNAQHEQALTTQNIAVAEQAYLQVDALQQQQRDLRQQYAKLEELRGIQLKHQQSLNLVTRYKQQSEAEKTQHSNALDQQQIEQSRLEDINLALTTLPAKQVELSQLDERIKQRKHLDQLQQTLRSFDTIVEQSNTAYIERKQAVTAASIFTRQCEYSWHSGQAALLAQNLQLNHACPVCGSKEHPSPAKIGQDEQPCNLEQVEDARQTELNNKLAEQQHYEQWQADKNKQLQCQQQIDLANKNLGEVQLISLTNLQQQQQKRNDELGILNQQQYDKRLIEQALVELKNQLQETLERLQQSEQLYHQQSKQHAVLSLQLEQVEALIPLNLRQGAKLVSALKDVEAQIKDLNDTLGEANKQHTKSRSLLDRASSNLTSLEQQDKQATLDLSASEQRWLQALEQSRFKTLEQMQAQVLSEQQQLILQKEIDQYQSNCDSLKGVINQLEVGLSDKSPPNLVQVNQLLLVAKQHYNTLESNWHNIEKRCSGLTAIRQKLQLAEQKNAHLEAEYAVIGTLSDVANGQTGNKISLQRFVLSVLLDDVLIQASKRLNLMSKGRYHLIRKENRAKGNKASGLELEVDDEYSGKSRAVSTLSGGESFMAALSLALGLSDVVQSYAGGIKLDALFIDEGFGSLDSQSLDLAISTLIDLQASGRMIGIISHVSELKEQMSLRLDVETSLEGSRVKVVGI